MDEELTYMAYFDPMTGLMNRNYFFQNLATWLEKAAEENRVVSVLFMDIDDFRRINDGMGILVGDETVQLIGEMLKSYANDNVWHHILTAIYLLWLYMIHMVQEA